MSQLQHRQTKIQEKRKQTPWREFVKEMCSRVQLVLSRNQGFISKYPPHTGRIGKLITPAEFEEYRHTLPELGLEYDAQRGFFEQLQQLYSSLDTENLLTAFENENTEYCDDAFGAKNAYLSFGVGTNSENVFYTLIAKDRCRNVFNSREVVDASENVYMSGGVTQGFNVFYSRYITHSANIWFSTNLIGCQECFLCDNLQNKSYCIRNQQFSKDEYVLRKCELLAQKDMFPDWYAGLSYEGTNYASRKADGNFVVKSEKVENGHYVYQVNEGRNILGVGGSEGDENMYDVFLGGAVKSSDFYGCVVAGIYTDNLYCSHHVVQSTHIFYSSSLDSCSYCLGCIGLKNKSFCIFNKQYEKEEWFRKVDEIFAQMEKTPSISPLSGGGSQLGDFFPGWMNPFYFNDTAAYLIDDSFTKEEVEAEGYLRRDEEIKVDIPEGVEVVRVEELGEYEGWQTLRPQQKASDTFLNREEHSTVSPGQACPPVRQGGQEGVGKTRHIDPSILKKVIRDKKGNYYRIVKMEYDFLIKHGLPLPRLHRLDRLKQNFKIS